VVKLDGPMRDLGPSDRAIGRPAPLGRAAGIEDLEAVALLVQRHVGVTEDHGVRVREASAKALQSSLRRTGVVDHREGGAVEVQGERLGELAPQLRAVDVAVNRGDRGQLAQLGQRGDFAEVTGVDDQIGGPEDRDAFVGQPPLATRQMGVGDQRETNQSSRCSERSRSASFRSR
jgi:hypothetical protein